MRRPLNGHCLHPMFDTVSITLLDGYTWC